MKAVIHSGGNAKDPRDRRFLNKAREVVHSHLGDEDFDVRQFVRKMGYSRTQTHRKVKALTNQSCSLFILGIRLDHAARLLRSQPDSIQEIARRAGFRHHSYFTKCFKERFGCLPRSYRTLPEP